LIPDGVETGAGDHGGDGDGDLAEVLAADLGGETLGEIIEDGEDGGILITAPALFVEDDVMFVWKLDVNSHRGVMEKVGTTVVASGERC
jgi:hypothetical protein